MKTEAKEILLLPPGETERKKLESQGKYVVDIETTSLRVMGGWPQVRMFPKTTEAVVAGDVTLDSNGDVFLKKGFDKLRKELEECVLCDAGVPKIEHIDYPTTFNIPFDDKIVKRDDYFKGIQTVFDKIKFDKIAVKKPDTMIVIDSIAGCSEWRREEYEEGDGHTGKPKPPARSAKRG